MTTTSTPTSATAIRATLEAIAKRHLNLDTLDTRSCQDLDFSDQAVWSIEAALAAAFAAGRALTSQALADAA